LTIVLLRDVIPSRARGTSRAKYRGEREGCA